MNPSIAHYTYVFILDLLLEINNCIYINIIYYQVYR